MAFDQRERALGLPAVHHDELVVPGEARHHDGDAPRHVKERHDEDEARGEAGADLLALATRRLHGGTRGEGGDGLAHRAVRRDGALGEARRSRRVEDRRVGVGVEVDLGHGRSLDHDVLPTIDAFEQAFVAEAHAEERRATAPAGRSRPRHPLGVADQERQVGVVDDVGQLLLGPPRVE